MNIKLYFAGFLLCFSSFGMNNEYKKDSHSIIGGNQARNDGAISQIVDFMNEQKFRDAQNLLEQHLLDKTFNVNAIFTQGSEMYTLLSYFLFICKNNIQAIKYNKCDASQLIGALVRASEGQMDEEDGHCYIRKNDSRIIEAMISAMNNQCFFFATFLVGSFFRKYLDFKTVFTYDLGDGEKEYTPFSYCLSFLKDLKYIENESDAAFLACDLLSNSKDQMDVEGPRPDCYIEKNDQRIKDIIRTFLANKRFKFVQCFLNKCYILCLYHDETFMYDLGDGEKEYTLYSLYLSVLKYAIKSSNYDDISFVAPAILINMSFEKNDLRIIDIGLCAFDSRCDKLVHSFFESCKFVVDVNDIMEWEDISLVVFSFYYMYIMESTHGECSFANRTRNMFHGVKTDYLTKKYKENMLKMISYLEEKKYHRLARLFLKEYFSNKGLYEAGIECNILYCYQYVLNQMEIRGNVDAGALQSIAKPQLTRTDLRDIKIFLEEKKYNNLTNALFSKYSSNKVLNANFGMNNESKKASHITENSQGIIGGTLEDQDNDDHPILQIANLTNKQKYWDASRLLSQYLSDKTFDVNTTFIKDNEIYTLLSYFLFVYKNNIQAIIKNKLGAGYLMEILVDASKDQMNKTKYVCDWHMDLYIRKDDSRIIDAMIFAMNNKCFGFAISLVRSCFACEYLDAKTVFRYGEKWYRPFSYYIDFLKDLKYIKDEDDAAYLGYVLFFGSRGKQDYNISKNDPAIIDMGLFAIDRKLFEFEYYFFNEYTIKYLDSNVVMEWEDISHVVFSFYHMYFMESTHDKDSFEYIARDTLNRNKTDYLTQKYKENMLKMISYLEEKKYHRLASLFLKEYFSNEKLQTPGIEYNILSCYQYVLNQTAHDDLTPTKMLEMISYLEEKKCHRLASLFLKEYFSKEGLRQEVIEHNILSCYRYVLNQMEMRENVDAQHIAKPQVTPTDLKDIMIFLEEKKCHSLTNALFYALGHIHCEHLHNEMLQLRKKIKQQIHNEYVLCVDIMNRILYYQEHYLYCDETH